MKVLVVDDDALSRFVLRHTLAAAGHEIAAAADGQEAWETLQRERFEVVICDWMMPNVDGLELTRRIRADGGLAYTYVILLSAVGGKGRYREGMDAGVDDFVTKPFDPEQLLARLVAAERVLRLHEEVGRLRALPGW